MKEYKTRYFNSSGTHLPSLICKSNLSARAQGGTLRWMFYASCSRARAVSIWTAIVMCRGAIVCFATSSTGSEHMSDILDSTKLRDYSW